MAQPTPAGRARAWAVVALLCVMGVLSYLDRYIIALLAQPIITDLRIDATDVGLLIGLGFGLLYAVSGVPVAHWLDRGARVRIVGAGVIVWSVSTVASAFAPDFTTLLITRAGVAIGEAVLVPATVSLIADLFPPDRRVGPIGVFMAMSTLMGSGSFLIGGFVYDAAAALSPSAGLAPWRLTLILVGAPGLILAPVWLAGVAEPPRLGPQRAPADATVGAAARYLRRHAGFYAPFLLSFGASAIVSYGFIAWSATILVRSYGETVADAGRLFGLAGFVAAMAAAVIWPSAGGRLIARSRPQPALLLLALGLAVGHTAVAGYALAGSLAAAIAVIAVATFGFGAAGGLAVLIVQNVAPPRMRAKITSLYMLCGNLLGLTCGPPLCAWLSETAFTGLDALRHALVLLACVLGPVTVFLIVVGARNYPVRRTE